MVSSSGGKRVLISALKRLMRPVVRLCFRHSLKLNDLIEIAKFVFVQVAQEELSLQGTPGSVSKISVMSGVHRKDVTRITKGGAKFKPQQNIISKVMVQWQHNERFCSRDSKPRALIAEGRHSEFAELVESINGGNLSAYAVLYEMERLGAVERAADRVKLVWRDFAPDPGVADGLSLLADDSHDLYQAVEENIFSRREVPNLHLKTSFDNVSAAALEQIRNWLLEQGSDFHRRVRQYISRYDLDLNPELKGSTAGARVVFGAFSLTSETQKSCDL